jgi:hypothetical protein
MYRKMSVMIGFWTLSIILYSAKQNITFQLLDLLPNLQQKDMQLVLIKGANPINGQWMLDN